MSFEMLCKSVDSTPDSIPYEPIPAAQKLLSSAGSSKHSTGMHCYN